MFLGVQRLFRHRRLAAGWTFVAGLLVTVALGWELHREAVDLDRQRLALRVAEIQSQLDARLEKTEMLLHNLRDYLMWSGETREPIFQRWCYENGLSINCPWLHGIAVATNRNEAQWQAQLPHPPARWTTNDWATFGRITRSHVIDCDIAVKSEVNDQKRFLPSYGLQRLGRDRDRLAYTMQRSRLSMSEHRAVMLDPAGNRLRGTIYFVPIYKPGMGEMLAVEGLTLSQGVEIRWMHLMSVILAPVDFKVLAEAIFDGLPSDVGLEIFSSTNQSEQTWLTGMEGVPRASNPKFKPYLAHRQSWPMYGQVFSIFFHTTPLFEAQSPRRLAKVAMAAGAGLTLLTTTLVGVALRARNRQELMTVQIREARDALAAAQLERNKISRDLHDGTIQSLYAIQLGLGHTVKKLEADPDRAGRELSAVRAELNTVIAEIRRFITTEAGAEKPVDFSAVLRALVERARAGATAHIELRCEPGAADRLAADQAIQLANIAREALSNSLRHAQPRQVRIALRSERESVALEIADDGTGFDARSPSRPGVGLASMSSRAREAGGTLEIQSSPGKGTCLVVRVPAPAPELSEQNGHTSIPSNHAG